MHLLRRRRRLGRDRQRRGIRKVRRQPPGARQAAAVRGNVLDQIVAGGRRRQHCPNLQGASLEARLWVRRLGLDDGLSRDGLVSLVVRVRMRYAIALLTFLSMLVLAHPTAAQQSNPNVPVDPDASAVKEETLLREAPRIEGRIDQPDRKARVLMQPAGRQWDHFHEMILRWVGAIVILGMIALLARAYLIRGRSRMSAGRSGKKILRFKAFERFSHWLTAVSFVILGLTGLNITFGKLVLLPVVGPDAFSEISEAAKYLHNFTSFAFMAGLVLIIVIFFKDNLPEKVDLDWLRQGGGFVKNRHAPAGRFNLGEKLVYWLS